jgi:hypothetical protein
MNLPRSTKLTQIMLLLGLGVTLTSTPASAQQFTKLLEVGQKVPGNAQPVTAIIEPTIGLDGQVAVLLKTDTVIQGTTKTAFQGIYSLPKTGGIRLLESGADTVTGFGTPSNARKEEVFSAPSISGGAIAYLRMTRSSQGSGASPRSTLLRVGTPGNVKTALNFQLSFAPPETGKPNLAFVNGKAYFLDDLLSASGVVQAGVLGVVDTRAATPSLSLLNQDAKNRALAVSSTTIVLTKVSSVSAPLDLLHYESTGNSSFQLIPKFNGCKALSSSQDNIAGICVSSINPQKPAVKLRLGRQGALIEVLTPDVKALAPSLVNPSISNRSVLYVRQRFSSAPDDRTRLDLSQAGAAPTTLLKEGDTLAGKTVQNIKLSTNGRSLAGNSAVVTVEFQGGGQALYRVDL